MINVVEPQNVHIYVAIKLAESKKTADAFAKDLGIKPQLLSLILNRKRQPSKAVLKKLGLKIVYQIV